MKNRKAFPTPTSKPVQNPQPGRNQSQDSNNLRIKSAKQFSAIFNRVYQKKIEHFFSTFRIFAKLKNQKTKLGCWKLFSFFSDRVNKSKYMAIFSLRKSSIRHCSSRNLLRSLDRIQKRNNSEAQKTFFTKGKIRQNIKTRGTGILKTEDKSQNKLARKPSQITIIDDKPLKTIDQRNKTKNKIQEEEINRLLEQIDDSLKRKDERKLVACLKKIVTKYSKAECLAKGFYIFKAFKELIGYKRHNEREIKDFEKLVEIMLSDSKHIDYYLKELRERKKILEKERKKDGVQEDPIKIQRIEKDLKNLEQLFDLIIEHYEGGYQHKRRDRKNLKSRSRNQSMYTGADGYTMMDDYSFADKSISIKKSTKNIKNTLLKPPNNQYRGHNRISMSPNNKQGPQYHLQSYKFSPQASDVNIENPATKSKDEKNNEAMEQQLVKYQNLYQQNKRILDEYKETMKSIELLTLDLRGLNYKINAQRNYEQDIKKMANMDLKQEIGIKDQIVKLYDYLKKQADRKINQKVKEYGKLEIMYQNEKDRAQASHNRFIQENRKVKEFQVTQKNTKNEKNNQISQLKENNKILEIEKGKIERELSNRREEVTNLQQKLKIANKYQSQNRKLQLQINKLIKQKQQLQSIRQQQKFRNPQKIQISKKLSKTELDNKKLQQEVKQLRNTVRKDKEQMKKMEKQVNKLQKMLQIYKRDGEEKIKKDDKIMSQMEQLENKFQNMVEGHKDQQISQLNAKIKEIENKSKILEEQKDIFQKERTILVKENQEMKTMIKKKQSQSGLEKRVLELQSKINPTDIQTVSLHSYQNQPNKITNQSKKSSINSNKNEAALQKQMMSKRNGKATTGYVNTTEEKDYTPGLERQKSSRLVELQKNLVQIENKKKEDRIQRLEQKINELEKHITILQQESEKAKMERKKRKNNGGQKQSDIFQQKHSSRNQLKKYPALPTSQLIALKLENANFQSLPEFTKSILGEYMKRIRALEQDLIETNIENDLLFHKNEEMKNKMIKIFEENEKNNNHIAEEFLKVNKELGMEIQSVLSHLQENQCHYCGQMERIMEGLAEQKAKILVENNNLQIQNEQAKCQVGKILSKYSELKESIKMINPQFMLAWKDEVNEKQIERRFFGHQSVRGKKMLQLKDQKRKIEEELSRINTILDELPKCDKKTQNSVTKHIKALKNKYRPSNQLNYSFRSPIMYLNRIAHSQKQLPRYSANKNQMSGYEDIQIKFEKENKLYKEIQELKQANRKIDEEKKKIERQLKDLKNNSESEHQGLAKANKKLQQANKQLKEKLIQKEELNVKLVLEKDEAEKKMREFQWNKRMKEADQIESRILGQKQAKMKRDWLSTQTPNTNCKNCVDISHYYMLMETYMEKLIMYLISQRNLVLTYEYREYCHYQSENKIAKDAEAYVKKWFEFTRDIVGKSLKKTHG